MNFTITITLQLWTVLPLILSIVMLAVVAWVSFNDADIGGTLGLLIAVVLVSGIWAPILYGRHEPWLVVPVIFTIFFALTCWRAEFRRDDLVFAAWVVLVPWLLVIYGRLTA